MASQHGKSEIYDTRLRNKVKDFLDNFADSNSKKALKACSELASDFPDAYLAKAALSIAYIKLGHFDTTQKILEESLKKVSDWISDPSSVHYFSTSMKALGRLDLLEQVYEKAIELDKKDKTHYERLFGACLRSGNSAKQISTAMDLFRLTGQLNFFMWSIVARVQPDLKPDLPGADSIVAAVGETKPSTLLQLAQAMFDTKFFKPGQLNDYREMRFMLRVIMQQGKFQDALEMLRSNLAAKFWLEVDRLNEEAALLHRLGNFEESRAIYEKLIKDHNGNDTWNWYLHYMETLFHSPFSNYTELSETGENSPNMNESTISQASSFIKSLQQDQKLRGPFLAELELSKRATGSVPVDLLHQYFQRFGSKPSCYRDLYTYVGLLSQNQMICFEKLIKADFDSNWNSLQQATDPSEIIKSTLTICNYEGLFRAIHSKSLNSEERKTKISSLFSIYQKVKSFMLQREATERFCGDELLLLAAHYYCDEYRHAMKDYLETGTALGNVAIFKAHSQFESSPLIYLLLAVITIEYGLSYSKFNFQFRLLLNEVSIALGATRNCLEQFQGVDIKHIQLFSCSYMFLDGPLRYCAVNDITKILKKTTSFFDDSATSTADFALTAYHKRAYHKVKEVITFAETLNHSAHRAALQLENFFVECSQTNLSNQFTSLITSFDPQSKLPKSLEGCSKLTTNYDTEAIDWWELPVPKHKFVEIVPGNFRSAVFPDANLQHYRLHALISIITALKVLATVQPGSPNELSPANCSNIKSTLEESAAGLQLLISQLADSNFESFLMKIILNILKLAVRFVGASPNLTTDKPDAENSDAAIAASSALVSSLNTLKCITSLVPSNNVPLVTQLLLKALPVLQLVLPVLPKLLPGKAKPKTPDAVKIQTSALKTSIRNIIEASKDILVHIETVLSQELTEIRAAPIQDIQIVKAVDPSLAPHIQKVIGKVLTDLNFSKLDCAETLLNITKSKIRDIKTMLS